MDRIKAIECEEMLSSAAKSLRCCWRIMKSSGMENTAKELADTVLDVEDSAKKMGRYIEELKT